MQNPQDRLIRYVQDVHATEVGIEEILENAIHNANDLDVRAALSEYRDVTRQHSQTLELRLKALNSDTSGGKGFINSLLGKVTDLLNIGHDDYDKATQDLIKSFATAHLQHGAYASLEAYANAFGDAETANLARQFAMEEEESAQSLFPHIAHLAQETYRASAGQPAMA